MYLQQSNEIWAVTENPSVFATDGADSAMFGLETNYGCVAEDVVGECERGSARACPRS